MNAISDLNLPFFGLVLEYSRHVCLSAIWQTYWHPAVASCFVKEATCYSLSGYVLFLARLPFVPMDMHIFTSCAMSFRVTCWCLSLSTHLYLSLHLSLPYLCQPERGCPSCDKRLLPCFFLFLMWLSLLMLFPIIEPFLFRVLGFLSPDVASGLLLCTKCILCC